MIMALIAKNKVEFVDVYIPQPDDEDLLYETWTQCNSMVISLILNSMAMFIGKFERKCKGNKIKRKSKRK